MVVQLAYRCCCSERPVQNDLSLECQVQYAHWTLVYGPINCLEELEVDCEAHAEYEQLCKKQATDFPNAALAHTTIRQRELHLPYFRTCKLRLYSRIAGVYT
jgi:hypothetical protein